MKKHVFYFLCLCCQHSLDILHSGPGAQREPLKNEASFLQINAPSLKSYVYENRIVRRLIWGSALNVLQCFYTAG